MKTGGLRIGKRGAYVYQHPFYFDFLIFIEINNVFIMILSEIQFSMC